MNPQDLIKDVVTNSDQHRLVGVALAKRCLDCGMFNKGDCPQEAVAITCIKGELARLAVERGLTVPPRVKNKPVIRPVKAKVKNAVDVIATESDLREFLEDSRDWNRVLDAIGDRLPIGLDRDCVRVTLGPLMPGAEGGEESVTNQPPMSFEDASFLERLKLKVKANYAQHKDIIRDFLSHARERGFELRTGEGTLGISDEQHIAEFTGENPCEIKKGS